MKSFNAVDLKVILNGDRCTRCGSCCEKLMIRVPQWRKDTDTQFYKDRGIKVFLNTTEVPDEIVAYLVIPYPCPNLLPPNDKGERLCGIYSKRNNSCKTAPYSQDYLDKLREYCGVENCGFYKKDIITKRG